ncbi:alpha/beta hydrolase [Adhaeribacter sp. BT258]|uniref:Alpha/beta hydrolase n=1 Tax=Adhaeribacter terrigena TaxID=2793070 RepID=A0ABS1C3T0_9BACT|nr:alpha/beta hydrolase [Adhaeribacter terrigena]MBK0404056.1 alpha/beta hydrolase [Adhaeribacter terrigena]
MPFITEGKTRLHYQKLGRGPRVLLAFHGFGQDLSFYEPVAEALRGMYTIYAFDLFFHGESWLAKNHEPLTKELLTHLLERFLEAEQIDTFSVAGFSMGGKFALTVLEGFFDKIHSVFLVAPDGIKTSFWYNVATYPSWLSGFFKRTVVKPQPFFRFVNTLNRYKLMHPSMLRFAAYQMNSPAKRLKIYKSWTGFRLLQFDLPAMINLLNRTEIPMVVFLGTFDKIITAEGIQFFTNALNNCQVITLKTGHSHLLAEVGNYLKQHPDLRK